MNDLSRPHQIAEREAAWRPVNKVRFVTAASLALSVLEKRLFTATCAVSVVSCAAVGRGNVWKPAFSNWGPYWFARRQFGYVGAPPL